jgi:spermidine synthase
MWGMALASKGGDPLDGPLAERLAEDGEFLEALRYYNPELHRGAFALPNFVRQLIEE